MAKIRENLVMHSFRNCRLTKCPKCGRALSYQAMPCGNDTSLNYIIKCKDCGIRWGMYKDINKFRRGYGQ